MTNENENFLNPQTQEEKQAQELKTKELKEDIKTVHDPEDLRKILEARGITADNLTPEMKKIFEEKIKEIVAEKQTQEKIDKEAEQARDQLANPKHHRSDDEKEKDDKEKKPDLFQEMLAAVLPKPVETSEIKIEVPSDIVLVEEKKPEIEWHPEWSFTMQDDKGNKLNSAPLSNSLELVIDDETTQKARRDYHQGAAEKEAAKEFYWKEQPENRDLLSKEGAIRDNESFVSIAGIAEDATSADARKAFLKLSREYHPDKVTQREAQEVGGVDHLDEEAKQRISSATEVFEAIKQTYDKFKQRQETLEEVAPEHTKKEAESFVKTNAEELQEEKAKLNGLSGRTEKVVESRDPVSVAEVDSLDQDRVAKDVAKVLSGHGAKKDGDQTGKWVQETEEHKAQKQQSSMHDID